MVADSDFGFVELSPIKVWELNLSSSSSINFRLGLLTLKLRRQYNVNDFTAQKSIELPTSTPIALKYILLEL